MANRCWKRRVGAWVLAASALAGSARGQVATVTVKSAGELLGQFRTFAGLADPASAKQILDGLDVIEATGALNWVARDRPLAATVDLVPREAGGPPSLPAVSVFLPVTGRDDFLEGLKKLGLAVDDRPGVEGFSHKVAPPGGNSTPAYVLSEPPDGYAVMTTAPGPDSVARLRAVKADDLKPARPGVVTAGVRLDRVPGPIKAAVTASVKQNHDAARRRRAGESDDDFEGRTAGLALVEDAFNALFRDGRELTFDADVAAQAGKFRVGFGLDARPGTELAGAFRSFGARRGRFAALWPAASVTLRGVVPVPERFRTIIRKSIDRQRDKGGKDQSPEDRRLLGLMLDALTPTLTGETFDACVAMGATPAVAKDFTNVVLFGVGVKDARKVEAALREAVAEKLKGDDRSKVAFDHDRGVDGTPIHRVVLDPKQLEPDEFGEPLMFLAFPEGAAFAAVGGNGLGVLKQALATPREPEGAPQVGLDFAAVPFSRIYSGENSAAFRKAAADVFPGPDAPSDRLRISLDADPDRLRLVLEADLPVLRFLARVGLLQRQDQPAPVP